MTTGTVLNVTEKVTLRTVPVVIRPRCHHSGRMIGYAMGCAHLRDEKRKLTPKSDKAGVGKPVMNSVSGLTF